MVVSDTSIKKNITMSIVHVHFHSNLIKKTIHHAVNVTSPEAELFIIRCGINQTIQIPNVAHIIIITNAMHIVYCIFNSSIHPYQHQSIAILKELREFFNKDSLNSIEFWDYSSNDNWLFYSLVDKETKEFNLTPLLPCKSS